MLILFFVHQRNSFHAAAHYLYSSLSFSCHWAFSSSLCFFFTEKLVTHPTTQAKRSVERIFHISPLKYLCMYALQVKRSISLQDCWNKSSWQSTKFPLVLACKGKTRGDRLKLSILIAISVAQMRMVLIRALQGYFKHFNVLPLPLYPGGKGGEPFCSAGLYREKGA